MSREKNPETTAPDPLQSCVSCRAFWPTQTGNFCRFAPPSALLVGMQQGRAGLVGVPGGNGASPVVGGFYPPTAPDNWCSVWRPKDFNGERPAIPVQQKSYRT